MTKTEPGLSEGMAYSQGRVRGRKKDTPTLNMYQANLHKFYK